ncbi:SagB/ThcOx family dehydrogenase [Candidatus Bathyarchaeota archaeon]|nr:SagB/ThcOx family dehydrogenase [Candidatus Bathyarchaeota archaeon]
MPTKENENSIKVVHQLMKALLQASSFPESLDWSMKHTPKGNGVSPPPLELRYDITKPIMELPAVQKLNVKSVDLRYAIENRRSIRNYSPEEVSLEDLSWLLWCTQGVREIRKERATTLRTVPSGGSRHPFETYLLVNRVKGLGVGLYRFLAIEHKLLQIKTGQDYIKEIAQKCGNQSFIANSAVVFLWSFVPSRSSWHFGPRAYKNFLEVGHVCQNLYLGAEAVDCGVCAIGVYDLEGVHQMIGIEGDEEFIVYIATLGKKQHLPVS